MKYLCRTIPYFVAFVLLFSGGALATFAATQETSKTVLKHFITPSPNYVMVVAHRGDWKNAPENSLRSVTNLLPMGVDIVEIDVQKTKDAQLILMHDTTIDRMTNGKGKIANLTLDEIHRFFLRDHKGALSADKVATLREVMLAVKGKPILVNIDKAWENLDLVLKITEETGTTAQVILKGNKPIEKLREQYGAQIDKAIYMPMVWPENYTIYKKENDKTPREYVKNFIENYRSRAFEVILKDEKSSVDDALDLIKKEKITVWINALWNELCAGHEDAKAIKAPDAHWGWIVRKGANVIQTDYPTELIDYLRKKGLR